MNINKSKTHNTVDCNLHTQRSKPELQCYNCGENHLYKDSATLRET